MNLLSLPIYVGVERAVSHFGRPRWGNLFGLLKSPIQVPDAQNAKAPPFIEMLWMPAYAICLETVNDGKHSVVWTSVDGWSGHVAFFDGVTDLRTADVREDAFPIGVSRPQAEENARRSVLQFTLRQRQLKRPVVEGVKEVRIFHYPVWVYYYRRGAKRIDIRVLDAYTGKPGGSRMRMAVLNALIAARKSSLSR